LGMLHDRISQQMAGNVIPAQIMINQVVRYAYYIP